MTVLRHLAEYEFGKRKPVMPNTGNLFCFNNNISSLYNKNIMIYSKKRS